MDMMKNPMEQPSEEKDMFEEAMGEPGEKIPNMELSESAEPEELMTYSELMEKTSDRLQAVNDSLEEEREITKIIRKKMKGSLSKDAGAKIKALESKVAELLGVYREKISPVRKKWAEAYLNQKQLLVEKPEGWDDMMKGVEVITPEDLEALPTEKELIAEETKLILKETEIEEEIDQLIDVMNKAPDLDRIPDFNLEASRIGMLRAELIAHIEALRGIRKNLDEIRGDLGIVRNAGKKAA